jgi:hypothetical protein
MNIFWEKYVKLRGYYPGMTDIHGFILILHGWYGDKSQPSKG